MMQVRYEKSTLNRYLNQKHQPPAQKMGSESTEPSSTAPSTRALRRPGRARSRARGILRLLSCEWLVGFLGLGPGLGFALGGCRAVPVPQDLDEEDDVQGEAGDEAVQDERVWDFLEGGEDAGEGAEEVVDDLFHVIHIST